MGEAWQLGGEPALSSPVAADRTMDPDLITNAMELTMKAVPIHRRVGIGKLEPLDVTTSMRNDIFQALVLEAQHYVFSDPSSEAVFDPVTIPATASILFARTGRPSRETHGRRFW